MTITENEIGNLLNIFKIVINNYTICAKKDNVLDFSIVVGKRYKKNLEYCLPWRECKDDFTEIQCSDLGCNFLVDIVLNKLSRECPDYRTIHDCLFPLCYLIGKYLRNEIALALEDFIDENDQKT